MNICILNGNPTGQNRSFENTISELETGLKTSGHITKTFVLRDMNIRYCDGCYSCWVKTPGECYFKDDSARIRSSFVDSEFVIFASPVIKGFTSPLLKKTIDKLIPLLHTVYGTDDPGSSPYGRYVISPRLGVLVEKSVDTDDDDLELIREIYSRNALSLKTSVKFVHTTDTPLPEILDGISCM